MSGQQEPTSPMPPPQPQPQPFRFWFPYRTNVGSWRQQPRPPSSLPVPTAPQPQPPPPPPPTPADLELRGGRSSMVDLELTLSGAPPTGQEQSSGRDGNRGNDTKIAISGFPRTRLFDGTRAPYRKETEDGLKCLAGSGTAASMRDNGQGYRVITLAGHNVGASIVVGNGGPRDAHATPPRATETEDPGSTTAKPPAVAANVNSNVQSVNNSSMDGSTCSAGNPGVHVGIKNGREEPPVATLTPPSRKDEKPKKRPPLVVPATTQDKSAAATSSATAPARARRCLRALMMENGSDTEAARKPKPSACRFQGVADHAPPATAASDGGGAGGNNAEDGA